MQFGTEIARLKGQYGAAAHNDLEADEEAAILARWRASGDPKDVAPLILSHLPLVFKMARKCWREDLIFEDLVQDGILGLMIAAHKFDSGHEARFNTYALLWVRSLVYESAYTMAPMVRPNSAITNVRRGLGKAKRALGYYGELDDEAYQKIADRLKVSVEAVKAADRFDSELSFEDTLHPDSGLEWHNALGDERSDVHSAAVANQAASLRARWVQDAIQNTLDAREAAIVQAHALDEDAPSLADLALEFNVSRERIRQIEARAWVKIGAYLLQRRFESGDFYDPIRA